LRQCGRWNTYPGKDKEALTERVMDKAYCLQTARDTEGDYDERAYKSVATTGAQPVAGICLDCLAFSETVELQKQCLKTAQHDCTYELCSRMLEGAQEMCKKFITDLSMMVICEPWEYRIDARTCKAKSCTDENTRTPRCGHGAVCKEVRDRQTFVEVYGPDAIFPPDVAARNLHEKAKTDQMVSHGVPVPGCDGDGNCDDDGFGYTCECVEDGYHGAIAVNKPAICVEYTCENGGHRGEVFDCGPDATCSNEGVGVLCTCKDGFARHDNGGPVPTHDDGDDDDDSSSRTRRGLVTGALGPSLPNERVRCEPEP